MPAGPLAVEPAAGPPAAPASAAAVVHDELTANRPWTADLDGMVERRLVRMRVVPNRTDYYLDRGVPKGLTAEYAHELERRLNARFRAGDAQPIQVCRFSSCWASLVALDGQPRAVGRPGPQPLLDPVEDEDLLELVDASLLPLAVVDNDKARAWARALRRLTSRDDLALRSLAAYKRAPPGSRAWATGPRGAGSTRTAGPDKRSGRSRATSAARR